MTALISKGLRRLVAQRILAAIRRNDSPDLKGIKTTFPFLPQTWQGVEMTALISKGLRHASLLHAFSAHWRRNDSPDLKGIKTLARAVCRTQQGRRNDSPDLKGIKTNVLLHVLHCRPVEMTALISKGLRHQSERGRGYGVGRNDSPDLKGIKTYRFLAFHCCTLRRNDSPDLKGIKTLL